MRPIYPHLHYGGTSCPGARWPEWVPQLAARAREMREEAMGTTPEEVKQIVAQETASLRAQVATLEEREGTHFGWLASAIGEFRAFFAAAGDGQKHGWTANSRKQ